jgi:hypothetical protein
VAAFSHRPRPAGRGVRSHALRRRRAARHLGARQPNRTCRALLPDASHGEGTNLRYGKEALDRELDAMISKFPSTEELHVVVAGGTAGRFSVAIRGRLGTRNGSRPVTRAVQ